MHNMDLNIYMDYFLSFNLTANIEINCFLLLFFIYSYKE